MYRTEVELEVKILKNAVILDGALNEHANYEEISSKFAKLSESLSNDQPILIDTQKVYKINSFGIFEWATVVQKLEHEVSYINTPWIIIQQMNITPDLLGKYGKVQSFFAPYYDTFRKETVHKLLSFEIDVPVMDSYDEFEVESISIAGRECEPDFYPEEDFLFVNSFRAKKKSA